MIWTEKEIAILVEGWEAGVTCGQIAIALGTRTRNAVIGRAHRMGLSERASPIKDVDIEVIMEVQRLAIKGLKIKEIMAQTGAGRTTVIKYRRRLREQGLVEGRKGYDPKFCQWIPGEPDGAGTIYCVRKAIDESSYCNEHEELTHRRPSTPEEKARWAAMQQKRKYKPGALTLLHK
jgi:GcrA cell cycle regulator|tara:strand:+ start:710 stop:1240 length:531 start_codon:yes stop_codon:yes gene_type:complete